MDYPSNSEFPSGGRPAESPPASAEQRLSALASLLSTIDDRGGPEPIPSAAELSFQNQLVQVRLGVASGLFAALRAKHAATASHSLRVALGASAWAASLGLRGDERDQFEVAALLHDIGKIGVPDSILTKPGQLTSDEIAAMDRHRRFGAEILGCCCPQEPVLEIVRYAGARYDGRRAGFDRVGEDIPLGSRMLAIVDAFDAMTTDQVYRRALSRERAMAELFACSGTQFDLELVQRFAEFMETDHTRFTPLVTRRWLEELRPGAANAMWGLASPLPAGVAAFAAAGSRTEAFHQRLLDSMHDGVIFVDREMKVILWNRAAETLTGIPAETMRDKRYGPELLEMWDEREYDLPPEQCPLLKAVALGTQNLRRLSIRGRAGERMAVDAHSFPVRGPEGALEGAALLLHDASNETSLEERVQSLHERATRDALTQVANRAEFDRCHEEFVRRHLQKNTPCALIICDIDYFKKINDTYGHQAGDEALVSFATLLRTFCRGGDLVGRYGGEEFVMLCADCDNATATARAEEIRRELERTPQSMLGDKCLTASFGVTELQPGDTPETMLRRADRALLQAKESGRNMVIQLGSGIGSVENPGRGGGWFGWLMGAPPDQLLQRTVVTAVPLKVAIEKLKGFVADHHAEVVSLEEERVVLRIEGQNLGPLRRRNDRPVPFFIELQFAEQADQEAKGGNSLRTLIEVTVRPRRNRDRRRRDAVERARVLLTSLKSYLMAQDSVEAGAAAAPREESSVIRKAMAWLGGAKPEAE